MSVSDYRHFVLSGKISYGGHNMKYVIRYVNVRSYDNGVTAILVAFIRDCTITFEQVYVLFVVMYFCTFSMCNL